MNGKRRDRADEKLELDELVRDAAALEAFEADVEIAARRPQPELASTAGTSTAAKEPVAHSVELVQSAQRGDAAALNRLFERYYDRVRRIVRMRLGRRLRNHVEANDILQDTFAAAVAAFDRFEMREEASLINWLAKLAERQILAAADRQGAKKRDPRREIRLATVASVGDSSHLSLQLAANVEGPLERLSRAEQERMVEAGVAELGEEYRELIILRDYTGASWEAIAKETHRPTAAAARMMHARALIELGRILRAGGL